ncbi:hypothetical protein KEM54_006131 [Ascosphaera aggregata]|nr:hypothetical protein KEM54_006131 [Ascosphaera aggregata]
MPAQPPSPRGRYDQMRREIIIQNATLQRFIGTHQRAWMCSNTPATTNGTDTGTANATAKTTPPADKEGNRNTIRTTGTGGRTVVSKGNGQSHRHQHHQNQVQDQVLGQAQIQQHDQRQNQRTNGPFATAMPLACRKSTSNVGAFMTHATATTTASTSASTTTTTTPTPTPPSPHNTTTAATTTVTVATSAATSRLFVTTTARCPISAAAPAAAAAAATAMTSTSFSSSSSSPSAVQLQHNDSPNTTSVAPSTIAAPTVCQPTESTASPPVTSLTALTSECRAAAAASERTVANAMPPPPAPLLRPPPSSASAVPTTAPLQSLNNSVTPPAAHSQSTTPVSVSSSTSSRTAPLPASTETYQLPGFPQPTTAYVSAPAPAVEQQLLQHHEPSHSESLRPRSSVSSSPSTTITAPAASANVDKPFIDLVAQDGPPHNRVTPFPVNSNPRFNTPIQDPSPLQSPHRDKRRRIDSPASHSSSPQPPPPLAHNYIATISRPPSTSVSQTSSSSSPSTSLIFTSAPSASMTTTVTSRSQLTPIPLDTPPRAIQSTPVPDLSIYFTDPFNLPIHVGRSTIEYQRLNMLSVARKDGDLFYLVLHQLYCTLSIQPGRQLSGLRKVHCDGLELFAPILVKNSHLRGDFLLQSANYPTQIETCFERIPRYRETYEEVLFFLGKIARNLHILDEQIKKRGFPPLIEEMVAYFAVPSPILRNVIHTAYCRAMIGSKDPKWLTEFGVIYKHNIRAYSEYLSKRRTLANGPSQLHGQRFHDLESNAAQMRRNIGHAYTLLVEKMNSGPSLEGMARVLLRFNYPRPHRDTPESGSDSIDRVDNTLGGGSSATCTVPKPALMPASVPISIPITTPASVPAPVPAFMPGPIISPVPPSAVVTSQAFSQPREPVVSPVGFLASEQQSTGSSAIPTSQPVVTYVTTIPGGTATVLQPTRQVCAPPSLAAQRGGYLHMTAAVTSSAPEVQQSTASVPTRAVPAPSTTLQDFHNSTYAPMTLVTHSQDPAPSLQEDANLQQLRQLQERAVSLFQFCPDSNASTRPPQPQARVGPFSSPLPPDAQTPLFPPRNVQPTVFANPRPRVIALHETHLAYNARPVNSEGKVDTCIQLFQFFEEFIIRPKALDANEPSVVWSFDVSEEMFKKLPVTATEKSEYGSEIQGLQEGNKLFQFRCVKDPKAVMLLDHRWSVLDTAWPECFYFEINGAELPVRRKNHYGKDIPLNITPFIKEGKNTLRITVLHDRAPRTKPLPTYLAAVELIDTASRKRVRNMIRRLTAGRSFSSIQKRLHASLTMVDDELTLVDDDMTIDLIDPFTALIFKTPVRGTSCLHRECFDLETFLETRLTTVGYTGVTEKLVNGEGMSEEWRCPICGQDVRPRSLMIDGFLVDVRKKLEDEGKLDTRAIKIKKDGSWEPKQEKSKVRSEARPGIPKNDGAADGGSILRASRKTEKNPQWPNKEESANVVGRQQAPMVIELD